MRISKKGTERKENIKMIYILLLIACPLLVVLFLVYLLNIFYILALITPGLIVCSLLFVLGEEFKSPLLIWLSFIFFAIWFIYVMKKIDNHIDRKINAK